MLPMPGRKELMMSTSDQPDLDWSQVAETVRMLNLAVAQIAMAMHEGEDSVESLSRSFTEMVGNVNAISLAVAESGGGDDPASRGDVLQRCAAVQGRIQQNIMAFQFYDRLSQRLDHVRFALDSLSALVADNSRLFNPGEWHGLQQTIRSRYTMREEQDMFEALASGATVEEALEMVRAKICQGEIDDIELF
jgi:hypothetical protein